MRFPTSRVLCSRIADILLRHKAQPLADKSWRIYLAEAVDAGFVETGTEGVGREWVQVAVRSSLLSVSHSDRADAMLRCAVNFRATSGSRVKLRRKYAMKYSFWGYVSCVAKAFCLQLQATYESSSSAVESYLYHQQELRSVRVLGATASR